MLRGLFSSRITVPCKISFLSCDKNFVCPVYVFNRNEEKRKRKEREERKVEQMQKETADYQENLADLQRLCALKDVELNCVRKKIDEQGKALKKKEEEQLAGLIEDV